MFGEELMASGALNGAEVREYSVPIKLAVAVTPDAPLANSPERLKMKGVVGLT